MRGPEHRYILLLLLVCRVIIGVEARFDLNVYCAGWGEEYPSAITALYFCGSNFNAGDQSHSTPLHLAAAEGHAGTVRQLVEYGARLNVTNLWDQSTPLGVAEEANQSAVVTMLRSLGAKESRISRLGPEPGRCDSPPCEARCYDDKFTLALGSANWGCFQNNFFMGQQPVIEPAPPKKGQGLGVIQGDTVT